MEQRKKRLILHIGRHKSGTTALQVFLHSNRAQLKKHDIYYPETGIIAYGHHAIPECIINRQSAIDEDFDFRSIELIDALHTELQRATQNTLLLSSESFQNIRPELVKRAFAGFEITPVVYIRDQLNYLASAYAQLVQVTNLTLSVEDYYQQTFSKLANYELFIDKWDSCFEQRLRVSLYDREHLVKGSIVDDFLVNHLQITDDTGLDASTTNANPTLSAKYVTYKRHLNQFLPPDYSSIDKAYRLLVDLSDSDTDSEKYILPRNLAKLLVEDFDQSNKSVSSKLFDNDLLSSRANSYLSNIPESGHREISLAEFLEISEIIVRKIPAIGSHTIGNGEGIVDSSQGSQIHRLRKTVADQKKQIRALNDKHRQRADEFHRLAQAHKRDNVELRNLRGKVREIREIQSHLSEYLRHHSTRAIVYSALKKMADRLLKRHNQQDYIGKSVNDIQDALNKPYNE